MTCCAALWATGGCLWLTFKKRESAEPQSVTLSGVSVCWVAKIPVFSLLVCDCVKMCVRSCLVVQPADVVSVNLAFDWSWRCENITLTDSQTAGFVLNLFTPGFVLKIRFSYSCNLKNSQHGKIVLFFFSAN